MPQREKAWAIRPYPCTGIGAFLSPSISQHPAYTTLLPRLKAGGKFLDIGCYMGQDLRQLALDGVPQSNLIGNDIVNHWDLGYEFFNDRDNFYVPYIESDLLFPSKEMKNLHGKINIISIVHVLHQWDWDTQVLACKELVKYSKPGSSVIGYQGGTNDIAKRMQFNIDNGHPGFTLHDAETFQRMWKVVGEETSTKWNIEATIVPWNELAYRDEEIAYIGSDFALLRFLVTRVV
jgi:SAM-dependent methyltransferase